MIVKIYTALFGLQSYLFKGIRTKTSKIRPGFFQPLTLLDMEVYYKQKNNIQSAKEVFIAYPYQQIPFDIRKSSIGLFINELVYKSIREEESNPVLFSLLWQTLLQLDTLEENVGCFHLVFAMHLTRHLGIFPQENFSPENNIFDLKEGYFREGIPGHSSFLDPGQSKCFHLLLTTPLALYSNIHFNPVIRSSLLETIISYYQFHLPGFKGLQSHHVLHSVLS